MCTQTSLEEQYEAVKAFLLAKEEITTLVQQGMDSIQAYETMVNTSNHPLLLRYYASPLQSHAMTEPTRIAREKEVDRQAEEQWKQQLQRREHQREAALVQAKQHITANL